MQRLKCFAQNYAWGTLPPNSEVAELFRLNQGLDEVEDGKPYAELWIGAHPNGPSIVVTNGETLEEWTRNNPEALGDRVSNRFQNKLPFLFKVLSIRAPLSIQSHPDNELAKALNSKRPNDYKDPNHKPEMAIALGDFEALCGFAPFAQICEVFERYPEIKQCISEETTKNFLAAAQADQKQALKEVFTELMLCPSEIYSSAVESMVVRLSQTPKAKLSSRDQLVLDLNFWFPGDVGILAACFLNHLKLSEGEALSIDPNEPHAYLKGDLMECMATSDNVIRAGLTPKKRDTSVLCDSLTYNMAEYVVETGKTDGLATIYRPPFEEFEVHKISLSANQTHDLPPDQGPSLILVQKGKGLKISESNSRDGEATRSSRGDVYFVPSNASVTLSLGQESEGVVVWQARVNSSVFSTS